MEKINEFFYHVKERLSSPLFYSFIISWVFCNWEISVALIWYDPSAGSFGHVSLIDFISKKVNNYNSILYPLGLAILYTLSSPILKNLISAFQSWNSKWGDEWNLNILKGSKVPIDKYLSFKVQYEKRSAELEKAISSETVTQQQLEEIKTALMAERNQQNKLRQELSDVKYIVDNLNNIDILKGRWIRTLKTAMGTTTENIEIQNSNLFLYEGNAMEQKYSIHDFHFNPKDKLVYFTLFNSGNNSNFFSYNRLTYRHRGFSGVEYATNGSVEISYTKDEGFKAEPVEENEGNHK